MSPKKLSACGISYKAVEAGTGRSAAGYLTFEREHLFVQTGMRFPESFIAFEPTSVAKARDDELRGFHTFALACCPPTGTVKTLI